MDPKRIVEEGYDRIGGRYAEIASQMRAEDRSRYVSALAARLPAGAKVLDLGCGAGVPTTRELARHFAVTGVDISSRQIERARRNTPTATFIQCDMTELDFPSNSFDGVTAFFSIIHVPRQEQPALLKSIAAWVRPGGFFVGAMGTKSKEVDFNKNWLGAPMFWSGYDSEHNRRIVEESGLYIISAEETLDPHGVPGRFLWLIAQKPAH